MNCKINKINFFLNLRPKSGTKWFYEEMCMSVCKMGGECGHGG